MPFRPTSTSIDDPFFIPSMELSEFTALQAVARGEASEDQQKAAWNIILDKLCLLKYLTWGPTENTAFLAGREYVGRVLLELMTTKIGQLQELNKIGEENERRKGKYSITR